MLVNEFKTVIWSNDRSNEHFNIFFIAPSIYFVFDLVPLYQ